MGRIESEWRGKDMGTDRKGERPEANSAKEKTERGES